MSVNRLMVKIGASILVIVIANWAYQFRPLPPQKLYQARCTSCHILPDMCSFSPQHRVAVVQTMLIQQQATDVISENEAKIITRYLSEQLACQ